MDNLTQNFLDKLQEDAKLSTASTTAKLPGDTENYNYSWFEQPEVKDQGSLWQGAGAALWHFADTAAFGLPGVLLPEDIKEQLGVVPGVGTPWDQLNTAGKVGAVVGEAAGFLIPIGWIGKGVKYAMAGTRAGGRTMAKEAVKKGTDVYAKIAKEAPDMIKPGQVHNVISKEFATKEVKEQLVHHGMSAAGIKQANQIIERNVAKSLIDAFPNMNKATTTDITRAITTKLGDKGYHVNSVGQWVQKSLNTRFGLDTSSHLSKYVGHALEMTVNFSLYNLLSDGVQAIAGEQEFDPVNDVKHAVIFSAFLPFVSSIPGGGQIHIRQTRKAISKLRKAFKGDNYESYDAEQLSGLLKLLTTDNYLKNKAWMNVESAGANAAKNAWKSSVSGDKSQMLRIIRRIRSEENLDNIWGTFIKEAGKDLGSSVWRMMAGAAFFNASTLMDKNMLRNIEPEVLGAHLLVGAMFTKMRSPIFANKKPTLTDFQSKLRLLNYFGIDGTSLKSWNSYLQGERYRAAVQSGVMDHPEGSLIHSLLYNETTVSEVLRKDTKNRLGEAADTNEFALLRAAKEIADIKQLSLEVFESKEKSVIDLRDLSRGTAEGIVEQMKTIEINKKGEKLSEKNVNRYILSLKGEFITSGVRTMVESVSQIAKELGIRHEIDGKFSEFTLDRPMVRIEDLPDPQNLDASKMESVIEYQNLITMLKGYGVVGELKTTETVTARDLRDGKPAEKGLKSMLETLRTDNFGEDFNLEIGVTENNAWLALLKNYKYNKTLETLHGIVIGEYDPDIREMVDIRKSFEEIFGQEMPSTSEGIRQLISIKRPEKHTKNTLEYIKDKNKKVEDIITDTEWAEIEGSESYQVMVDRMHDIAEIWSFGRNTRTRKKVNVDFDRISNFVGYIGENYMNVYDPLFKDSFESMYTKGRFRNHSLDLVETRLIGLGLRYNIFRDDGSFLQALSREDMESQLISQGYEKGSDRVESLLKKYDTIMSAWSRIATGANKIIDYKSIFQVEGSESMGDYEGFIEQAYELSPKRRSELAAEYNTVRVKIANQENVLMAADAIVQKFRGPKGEDMPMNEKEALETIKQIDQMLESFKDTGLDGSTKIVDYFTTLRKSINENIRSGTASEEGFFLAEKKYTEWAGEANRNPMYDGILKNLSEITDTIQSIIHLNNYRSDHITSAGERRSELVRRLTEQLKKLEVEGIDDTSKLEEIYEKFTFDGGKLDISKFNDIVTAHKIAWENHFTPEQIIKLEQEIHTTRDMFESRDIQTPRLTFAKIRTLYGEYDDTIANKELWAGTEKDLMTAGANNDVNMSVVHGENIIKIVQGAIIKKNTKDNIVDAVAVQSEFLEFKRRFPFLMSRAFGTANIKTIHLSESIDAVGTSNKVQLVISSKNENFGAFAMFAEIMGKAGIEIYRVGDSAEYGNRKYGNHNDIDMDLNSRNKLWSDPAEVMIEDQLHNQFKGVKITVNLKDQIYVRTDNLVKVHHGIIGLKQPNLRKEFTKWYESIETELTAAGPSRDLALKNFRKAWEDFVREDFRMVSRDVVREVIKNMYMHHLNKGAYYEMMESASKGESVRSIDYASHLKYFNTAAGHGAKVKGSVSFLKAMDKIATNALKKPGGEMFGVLDPAVGTDHWFAVREALHQYENNKGLRTVSIRDEKIDGLSAESITRKLLVEAQKQFGPKTQMFKDFQSQIDNLKLDFKSLASSSVNAQSFLGTNAAHLIYLQRGRNIYDNSAGVKPVGSSSKLDIILKTNFIHDPDLANLMAKLKIDILTFESAAKRFGPGHTELIHNGTKKPIKSDEFKSYYDLLDASSNSIGAGKQALMKMEDFYFGKSSDRHKLVSVSYAIQNFLNKSGYDQFTTQSVNYFKKIDTQLKEIGDVMSMNSLERNAMMKHILGISRNNGEIFDDGSMGSLDRLIRSGTDVNSTLIFGSAEKMLVRRMIEEVSNPKSEHGSYSVLIPFTEGAPSVYKTINNRSTQIKFGGKKLSHYDGQTTIKDWNDVKFIVETSAGHDVQVGLKYISKEKGYELIVVDGTTKNRRMENKSEEDMILNALLEVKKKSESHFGEGNVKYSDLHSLLKQTFKRLPTGVLEELNIWIHSLSLRIPNLKGDVAVHKIEGFYEEAMGNVVGVNSMDLAVVHQGDFDVDTLSSHHNLGWEIAKSVYRNAGLTPDVMPYPKMEGAPPINPLNMDDKGKILANGEDSLESHHLNYHNSQVLFGSAMNIAPILGAIERLDIDIRGINRIKSEDASFVPLKYRLGNTLQSIVDSTKEPNFATMLTREEVLNWILFGNKPDRAGINTRSIDGKESEFLQKTETGKEGIFNITVDQYKDGQKVVIQDAIIEMFNILSHSNRVLTGVSDEAGRRPPDLDGLISIRNKLNKFFTNPNKEIFDNLLFKYKGQRAKQIELIKMFHGDIVSGYQDQKALLKDIFGGVVTKGKKGPVPDPKNIFLVNAKDPMNMTIGGMIAGRVADPMYGMRPKHRRLKVGRKIEDDAQHEILNKIDTMFILGGERVDQSLENLKMMMEGNESYIFGKEFGSFAFEKMDKWQIGEAALEQYSIFNHVLGREERSLQKFIRQNRPKRGMEISVQQAQHKLNTIRISQEYIEGKKNDLFGDILANPKGKAAGYYLVTSIDLRQRKGRIHRNRTKKPQYLYEVTQEAPVKYSFVSTMMPNKRKGIFLRGKKHYVVLKNPLERHQLSSQEARDAIALLKTVGEAVSWDIPGMDPNKVPSYERELSKLISDFSKLARETYNVSNKSAFSKENWAEARKIEDRMFETFVDKWTSSVGEGALETMIATIIKPTPMSGIITQKIGKNTHQIPAFKINRRLTLAAERYLNNVGANLIHERIFGTYGAEYRRMNDKITYNSVENMFRSTPHSTQVYDRRSPLLDYVFDQGLLYFPNILQQVRGDLKKYGGRRRKQPDTFGNLEWVISYEGNEVDLDVEHYSNSRKFYEDSVKRKVKCKK